MARAQAVDTAQAEPIVTERFAFDEAVSLIKRSRRKVIYLHAGMWAPFTVQNPSKPHEQGATYIGLVPLNRVQLVEFLLDAVPTHHRAKLDLYVSQTRRCMFVGSSPR
jgi:hypothetical protein